MNAKEFLQNKFNCTDDEIHKQLYDLVSDHRNWELVLKLFEDFKNQSEGSTNAEIKDLNDFDAYLIKVAESKVGFRFKVKGLKRVLNAIINQKTISNEINELPATSNDPEHINDDGKPFKKIDDADDLAYYYYPTRLVSIETESGTFLCKAERTNAWQPDGEYSYYFVKQST